MASRDRKQWPAVIASDTFFTATFASLRQPTPNTSDTLRSSNIFDAGSADDTSAECSSTPALGHPRCRPAPRRSLRSCHPPMAPVPAAAAAHQTLQSLPTPETRVR